MRHKWEKNMSSRDEWMEDISGSCKVPEEILYDTVSAISSISWKRFSKPLPLRSREILTTSENSDTVNLW